MVLRWVGFAVLIAGVSGCFSQRVLAEGFTANVMPNKQVTHLPGSRLVEPSTVTLKELPTHPWQAPPRTLSPEVGFKQLPNPHLLTTSNYLSPVVSFKRGAFSTRPVGVRTTLEATQVEIATRGSFLPAAQPMTPALAPDANVRFEPRPIVLAEPQNLLPRPPEHLHDDTRAPADRWQPSLAERRPADTSSPPSADARSIAPPRAGDYGDLLWQSTRRP